MADKEVLKKIIEDYVSNSVQPSETQIECDSLRIANARLADELNLKIDLYNKLYIAFQRVLADATEEGRALRAENARLRAALGCIVSWSEAYPLDIFPEPDFKRVRELLEKGGIALDTVSASNMRYIVTEIGKLARAALSYVPGQ